MSIAIVQSQASDVTSNATTISATLPGATTAGNLIVADVVWHGSSSGVISAPAGWTQAWTSTGSGVQVHTQFYWLDTAGGHSSFTFTWNSTANGVCASVYELHATNGWTTPAPLDQAVSNFANSSTTTETSGTTAATTAASEIAIAAFSNGAEVVAGDFTSPTNGYTSDLYIFESGATSQVVLQTSYKILTAISAGESTGYTVSVSAKYAAGIGTYAEASAAAPQTLGALARGTFATRAQGVGTQSRASYATRLSALGLPGQTTWRTRAALLAAIPASFGVRVGLTSGTRGRFTLRVSQMAPARAHVTLRIGALAARQRSRFQTRLALLATTTRMEWVNRAGLHAASQARATIRAGVVLAHHAVWSTRIQRLQPSTQPRWMTRLALEAAARAHTSTRAALVAATQTTWRLRSTLTQLALTLRSSFTTRAAQNTEARGAFFARHTLASAQQAKFRTRFAAGLPTHVRAALRVGLAAPTRATTRIAQSGLALRAAARATYRTFGAFALATRTTFLVKALGFGWRGPGVGSGVITNDCAAVNVTANDAAVVGDATNDRAVVGAATPLDRSAIGATANDRAQISATVED